MTEITGLSPGNGATATGRRPTIMFSITGGVLAPVVMSDLVVTVSGVVVVSHGVADSSRVVVSSVPNIDFGLDVTIRFLSDLDDNTWHAVNVKVPGFEDGWSFRVVEAKGPRLLHVSPAMHSDSNIGLPLVTFDVAADDGYAVLLRNKIAESNLGSRSGSHLTVSDVNFTGCEGRCVEIGGTPGFITTVLGPHDVITTLSGGGSGLNVKLFTDHGLDVTISGEKVVKNGVVQSSTEWTVVITTPTAGQFHVSAQKIGSSIANGTRVDVMVRAQSNATESVNVSDLWTYFSVGDNTAPRVGNVSPMPGTRGLSTATSTQPSFDVVDHGGGLNAATLTVVVDGVVAILNGTPQGDFSTSTVTNTTGGKTVVLKKSTSWPGPKEVTITVSASDVGGNAMTKATWVWHFGATSETFTSNVAGGQLVSNDVLRVVAFDFSDSRFARPGDREHNGYGHDGFQYEGGTKMVDQVPASWFSEASGVDRSTRAPFPISGFLVATASSWSILDSAGVMWMRCHALGSGGPTEWSMAGSPAEVIVDVDVGDDVPVFFLAMGASLVVIDFARDYAWRVNASGMANGLGLISSRNANQSGGVVNTDYAIPVTGGNFAHVAGVAWNESWVAIGVRSAQMDFVGELDDASVAEVEALRGDGGQFSSRSVTLPVPLATGGTWARVRATRRPDLADVQPVLAMFTTLAGLSRVVSADWLEVFGYLQSETAVIAVNGEPASDIDMAFDDEDQWIVSVATTNRVLLTQFTDGGGAIKATLDDLDKSDLGLDTVASGAISAVAMAPGFQKSTGYLFASATAVGDGKVTRWRHQPASASSSGRLVTMATGTPVRSVAAQGAIRHLEQKFVRAAMDISALSQVFVRSSMVVE